MKKLFFLVLCFLFTKVIYPQSINKIATDRSYSSKTAYTIPEKNLQIELGFTFENIESEYKPDIVAGDPYFIKTDRKISVPAFLIRYGVSDFIELRTGGEFKVINSQITEMNSGYKWDSDERDFENFSLGAKFNIQREKNFIPQIALTVENVIPSFDSEKRINLINPKLAIYFSNNLSKNFLIGYNGGVNIIKDGESNAFYSFSLNGNIFNEFEMFAEFFGTNFLNSGETSNYLKGGFSYLIKNNLLLDISGGKKLNKEFNEYFAGAGLTFRMPK
ncbi:MAG: transporter [Ignavibacteria bacterium]|nr:transporter [Ignavibacteria bacterium]